MLSPAHDVCQQILNQLRLSQLNFKVIETPFSAEVVVRKRFVKDAEGPHQSFFTPLSGQIDEVRIQNDHLEHENLSLLGQMKDHEDTIKLLEDKLELIEAKALKSFKSSNE